MSTSALPPDPSQHPRAGASALGAAGSSAGLGAVALGGSGARAAGSSGGGAVVAAGASGSGLAAGSSGVLGSGGAGASGPGAGRHAADSGGSGAGVLAGAGAGALAGGGHMPAAGSGVSAGAAGTAAGLSLPPLNAGLDYQLGGAYPPAASVMIVSRDRQEEPAPGLYNICYVNGFQAQQSENDFWLSQHPELVLRDSSGEPVVDQDWDEMLLDVSTADKRTALAAIEAEWIAGCASAGFDAVEIDNLDSYSRSGGRLKEQDAVAFIRLLADAAHAHGLAIAQKNASELVPRRAEMGTDFVVAEECNRYKECDDYRAGYDDRVLVIEYRRSDFDAGCAAYPQLSIVLRDVELVTPGQSSYVFDGC